MPGFSVPETELSELRVGVAWFGGADPLLRSRLEAAAAHFTSSPVSVELPLAGDILPLSMSEIAGGHRELYAEQGDLYGENIVNALGWPPLALPCGRAEDGLPASIQLAGRAGDALVLAAATALERALKV